MAGITIYHNPRCSKSRQTKALLEERDLDLVVVEYLKDPPSVQELDGLVKALGVEPLDIARTKDATFRELGLSASDDRSRSGWLQLLHDNPVLIERPIVVNGDKVAIGRPPENVLGIL